MNVPKKPDDWQIQSSFDRLVGLGTREVRDKSWSSEAVSFSPDQSLVSAQVIEQRFVPIAETPDTVRLFELYQDLESRVSGLEKRRSKK